jgi:hypothetical protein
VKGRARGDGELKQAASAVRAAPRFFTPRAAFFQALCKHAENLPRSLSFSRLPHFSSPSLTVLPDHASSLGERPLSAPFFTVLGAFSRSLTACRLAAPKKTCEVSYYVTSLHHGQTGDEELLKVVRDHFGSIENGSHHRRDVTYREDACRIGPRGAQPMAALRNLAIGLYEMAKAAGKTRIEFSAWCRRMTFSQAREALRRR